MRCPSLNDLPAPPPAKSGWPWTKESLPLAEQILDGSAWPRVSIVTPSYNQSQFLEEAIRSVLLQGYPNLEYIVIDGGSTDRSVEIIRKYEPWLAYWVSEPDRGQSHAINKGFARATGDIVAWLNSDDWYQPDALVAVGNHLGTHSKARLIFGNMNVVDANGQTVCRYEGGYTRKKLVEFFRGYYGISQQSSFFHRRLLEQIGLLDESLDYIMDYEFFLRASEICEFDYVNKILANFRLHDKSKTRSAQHRFAKEHLVLARKYIKDGRLGHLNSAMYLRDVSRRYTDTLVGAALGGTRLDGRHRISLLWEAGITSPELWKERWFRGVFAKALLGPRLTGLVQIGLRHVNAKKRAGESLSRSSDT